MKKIILIAVAVLMIVAAVLIVSGAFKETEMIVVANGKTDNQPNDEQMSAPETDKLKEQTEPEEETEYEDDSADSDSTGSITASQYTPKPSKKPVLIEVQDEQNADKSEATPTLAPVDKTEDDTESDDEIGRIAF